MRRLTIGMVILATLWPAVALAAGGREPVPLTGVTLLAPPFHDDCELGEPLRWAQQTKLERAKGWLRDAERSPAGVKDAMKLGPAGTKALAEWLSEGAPGGDPRYVVRAARRVVLCTEAEDVAAAAGFLALNEYRTMEVLKGRVPVFTSAQIEGMRAWFGQDEGADHEYLRLLIGSFKIQVGTGFLLWGSRRTTGVRGSSPVAHHVDEVMRILTSDRDPGLYTNAAKGVLIYVAHGVDDAYEWGPVLRVVLSMKPDEYATARRKAALAVGRALPLEHARSFELLLTQGWEAEQLEAVAGLEDRALVDESPEDALTWLDEFAERGLRRAAVEARRVARKVRREYRL